MGNSLCKPVPEQFIEPPKKTEPLLTEEAIKILNVEPIVESAATVSETTVNAETVNTLEETEDNSTLIQPSDESSSTSSKEEATEPPKKKRGRKRKCDQ